MIYSSTNNDFIKDIKKLNEKKYRDHTNTFLIEGEHIVKEAIKKGYINAVIVKEGETFNIDESIKCIKVTDKVLRYISNLSNPQPIMAVCSKIDNNKIGNRIIVLDNIQDPGNLGTIIRSMVAFNFDTLILSNDSVDIYNSKVIRATQGMIFKLNIIITDIKSYISKLDGYKIIGTNVSNGRKITDFKNLEKFAIIMGNEGNGIKEDILKMCSDNIYIPISKECESLNVGVAASIIMYELGDL